MPKKPYPKWYYGVAAGVYTLFFALIILVVAIVALSDDGSDGSEDRDWLASFEAGSRTGTAEVEEIRRGWNPATRTAVDDWVARRDASKTPQVTPTSLPQVER